MEEQVDQQQPQEPTAPAPPPEAAEPAPSADLEAQPSPEVLELRDRLKKAEGEVNRQTRRANFAIGQMDAFFRQQQPAPADPEPQQNTFGDDQVSYVKAHAAWTSKQTTQQAIAQDRQLRLEQAKQAEQGFINQEKLDRINQGGPEVYAACNTLGEAGCVFGTTMNDALFASENFD